MINKLKTILILFFVCIICFPINSFALVVPKDSSKLFGNEVDTSDIEKDLYNYDKASNGYLSKDIRLGDTVTFGRYYNLDDEGNLIKEPILWTVISKADGKALLMTKYIIDTCRYNYFWESIDWENSDIRKWLNSEFYDTAFTDSEKEFIVLSYVQNHENIRYKSKAGRDTYDKVFLFSIEEIKRYFFSEASLKSFGTKYALQKDLWVSKNGNANGFSVWWLRSPGRKEPFAALIHAGGAIGEYGDPVSTTGNGIRPSIWVVIK